MPSEDRMLRSPIILSDQQRQEHHTPAVQAEVIDRERGDGWVMNVPDSVHLAGKVILRRVYETSLGKKRRHDFMPIDSALLQIDKVKQSIVGESEQIDGDLTSLSEQRSKLLNWLTLPAQERLEIGKSFGFIAESRDRAINPLNKEIGERAAKMQTLKDSLDRPNPGAVLAQSQKLEKDLIQRDEKLIKKNLPINSYRLVRMLRWAFNENRMVDYAYSQMARMISDPQPYDIAELRYKSRQVHFRIHPFNQLAYAVKQSGDNTASPEAVEAAMAGIRFHRMHNYLALPFRILAGSTLDNLEGSMSKQADSLLPAIAERMDALESREPGRTYNSRLIGRLLKAASNVEAALHQSNAEAAWNYAKEFRWLHDYHTLPIDDSEMEVWYGHRL